MKIRMKILIAVVTSLAISASITLQSGEIDQAGWLIGTWENKTSKGSIYETWSKINSNEFSGKSYIVKESDTIVFETIQLIQERNGLLYIPTVKSQNEGLPVPFTSTAISDTRLIFENLKHDFPKIISYTKITADSLVAEISGTKDGKYHRQSFPMRKVN